MTSAPVSVQSDHVNRLVDSDSTDENPASVPIGTATSAPTPAPQDQLVFSTSSSGALMLQKNSNPVSYGLLVPMVDYERSVLYRLASFLQNHPLLNDRSLWKQQRYTRRSPVVL